MELKRIAIDTSKHVFTLHGVDPADRPVLRRNLSRSQMESFFAKQPATEVVLEACGSSHHWGRTLAALGHQVRLIPPQYVKPFVKRGKNDRNDADAISEAAGRPDMPFVPVKSADSRPTPCCSAPRDVDETTDPADQRGARPCRRIRHRGRQRHRQSCRS